MAKRRGGGNGRGDGKRNGGTRERGPAHGYPRPQLVREDFTSLAGPWDFQIDQAGELSYERVRFGRTIRIPFAPECPASGVEETGYFNACWYRRTFDTPKLADDQESAPKQTKPRFPTVPGTINRERSMAKAAAAESANKKPD